MAGMTLRVFYALGRALGCGAYPVSEQCFQGNLASTVKEAPVLVSALVFLLKTGSVVLHSAAPLAQEKAAVHVWDEASSQVPS